MFNKELFLKIGVLLFVAVLFFGPGFVSAGVCLPEGDPNYTSDCCDPTTEICFTNPIAANSLQCFLKDLLQLFAEVGSIFVILAIIYAGFLLVTARGNETKLATGKQALMWAVIGGAVVLGAWALSVGIASTIGEITGSSVTSTTACP